jgi:response regulator RpfG family c-di-GMP phosphodiesterase
MNILILWNKNSFSEQLASAFGSRHVIYNADDFNTSAKDFGKYDAAIVLCELNWTSKGKSSNLQDFSGIEIAKELRRAHNLSIPILFTSFLPLNQLFNSEREILTAIGHSFLQLPAIPKEFTNYLKSHFTDKNEKVQKLSVMELNDIKSFYCSKEGILSHELHALNHYLNFNITAENHDATYAELLQTIKRVHELFLVDATHVEMAFQVAFPKLTQENISDAVNHIVRLGNELLKTYGVREANTSTTEKSGEKYRWKVLLLDDQIDKEHDLVKQMKTNNIQVICVDNADDAENELKKDWKKDNAIMVVIADYRLFENINGIKHHQKVQGYQFLKNIATSDHLVRLVAFSGLQRKFLLNSFKHYNIRTEVKSKTDYLTSKETRQLFCEEIIELAEENWEAIEALPTKCAGFEKYLKDAYKEFRLHPDYNKMESNISITAREYVWEIQQQIAQGEEIRIGAIENIKSPLAKTKKDPEAFFKRLQNYLTARRIALWLYAANKKGMGVFIDSRRIAEILTDQKYPTDAYRQILSTNLGLSLDDFPKNITIEERRWLHYDMQLNIFRDINQMNPVFIKLSKVYKEYIAADKSLEELLSKLKHILHHKYKLTDYSISFTKDFSPELKTSTDVRVMFLWIAGIIKKDKSKLSSLKPLVSILRFTLFESRDRVIYLKNLFEYFNAIYSILNKEQVVLASPSSKVKDKSTFQEKSVSKRNDSFDRAYQLLNEGELPNEKDSADVFHLFLKGEELIREQGSEILKDKAKFLSKITKAINDENRPLGNSLDEGFGKHNPTDDDDWDNDSAFDEDLDFPDDDWN